MTKDETRACPKCGKKQRIRTEWIGKRAKCGSCGNEFVIGVAEMLVASEQKGQSEKQSWIDDEGVRPEDAFRTDVKAALADGIVTPQEKATLESTRQRVGLSTDVAKRIFDEEKAYSVNQQPVGISSVDTNKVGKLLQLAARASDSGNHAEAINLFGKALEEDPQNCHAWFGKAKSIGPLCSLANFRLLEMLNGFNHAVEYAPREAKEELEKRGACIVAEASATHYEMAKAHLQAFAQLDVTWPQFLDHALHAKVGLTAAHKVLNDPEILKKCILICCDCIKGVRYYPLSGGVGVRNVTAEMEEAMRDEIAGYAHLIRQLEPDYAPPKVERLTNACFVVTAVLGDPAHPQVRLLRGFRDTWLVHRNWGRIIVSFYWKIGPWLAMQITDRPVTKRFVRYIVIIPACWLAYGILLAHRFRRD